MKRIILTATAGLVLAGFSSAPVAAAPSLCDSISGNLVVNCGFETGDLSGWTNFGNTGFTSVGTPPHTGSFAANVGPVGSDGFLSQLLPIVPGIYQVDVWFQSDGGIPGDFTVTFDGIQGVSLVNPAPFAYTEFSFLVSSAGGPASLVLAFRNDPGFYQIDDISVVPVPEPSTLGLIGLGLLGVGAMARRRRNAV